ncbi:MAG: hypothetical protein ABI615_02195 [Chthoniobacterales bacterium]
MKSPALLLLFCMIGLSASAAPNGAILIPRNGAYEGRAGKSHVLFDTTAGGILSVVEGEWPALKNTAQMDIVFKVQRPDAPGNSLEIKQSNDRSPNIIIIEEGNQRVGVRVNFKLFDSSQHYFGHGMTETWLYPNGEIFINVATSLEGMMPNGGGSDTVKIPGPSAVMTVAAPRPDSAQNETVTEAAIRISHSPGLKAYVPEKGLVTRTLSLTDKEQTFHALTLGDNAEHPAMALYWLSGKGVYHNFVFRKEGDSPTYERWPVYMPQVYAGESPRDILISDKSLDLRWLQGSPAPKPNPTFVAAFRMMAPAEGETIKNLVAAETSPLDLKVDGGEIYGKPNGYNDMEGAYEIRKTSNPVKISLPSDSLGRTIRVKVIGISGHGAVTARLNGQPVIPQLTGEGGIADDPLAPIREQPEGPADMALLTIPLGAQAQTLEVSAEPGVQLAYQTRDTWRSVALFSTRTGGRYPGFRFSLVDGRLRNMRGYGQRDWALTENLLTWFSTCGFTPEQMIDQLTDFEILKNGPSEAEFRYVSRNATQGVQSEYSVRVPANSPAMQINVTATFTVLKSWPYEQCQFFDVFPFRGVWPQDWWYEHVLWLSADGRWKTLSTLKRTFDGDKELTRLTEGGFFAFYSAERGNMLMLTKNIKKEVPVDYVICGNYVDFHMTMNFLGPDGKPHVPAKDFSTTVQYDLAIWGDKNTTREQLIEIGKKSIAAGHLVLPGK